MLIGPFIFLILNVERIWGENAKIEAKLVDVVDLTTPTSWKVLSDYYLSVERNWKICIQCGIPGIGTAMHLEHHLTRNSMHPSVIPTEYLITKLVVIDLSFVAERDPNVVITREIALQWKEMKEDHVEPTVLLFKFGWKEQDMTQKCACKVPGIAYDLASYIVANLTSVVGVATDAPTLESEETRELTVNTIAQKLGTNGIYMIENVNLKRKIPERGCIALAMPVKIRNFHYVPTRLTALCPINTRKQVTLSLRDYATGARGAGRDGDVHLEELM